MDLLFTRYASPFILIDTLIQTSSLSDFIGDMFKFINEEKAEKTQWEFFLHKIFDKSWDEFSQSIKPTTQEPVDLGATIKNSKEMLNSFIPEGSE